MTPQEREALAAKLTRIWASEQVVDWFSGPAGSDNASFAFRAMLTEEVCFTCRDSNSSPGLLFRLGAAPHHPLLCQVSHLRCHSEVGDVEVVYGEVMDLLVEDIQHFAEEWMDIFRRNCWLSGCALECSAHEQLEWTLWYREQEAQPSV